MRDLFSSKRLGAKKIETHLKVSRKLFHNGLPGYEALDEDICGLQVLEFDVLLDEGLVS